MKTIIVEDRENVRELMIALVNSDNDLILVGVASSVKEAVDLIQKTNPEIALMDIELPDGKSFDILSQVNHHGFKIIFITSHEDYAIEAFRYSAIDYLLKPFDPDDFFTAIKKAKTTISLEDQKLQLQTLLYNIQNTSNQSKKIVLNTANSIHVVQSENILRCESDDSYTTFFLVNGKKILVSKKLKEYDEMLTPFGFILIHRSHLINLSQLDYFDKKVNLAYLLNGSHIPVSSRKRDQLLKLLKK